MKEISSEQINGMIEAINAARKGSNANAKEFEAPKNMIGNNGRMVGQTFTLTGELNLAIPIAGTNNFYEGLALSDGTYLSVKRLMGLSSLKGYETSGTLEDSKGNKFVAQTTEDFDFEQVFQPASRDYVEFLIWIQQNLNELKGRQIQLVAEVHRQIKTKKASTDFNGVTWKVGDTRVMSALLWKLI